MDMTAQAPQGQAKRRGGRPPSVAPQMKRIAIGLDEEEIARFQAYRAHVAAQLKGTTLADAQIAKMLMVAGLEAFEAAQHPVLFPSEAATTRK